MKLGNETFKRLPLTTINQWQTEDWRSIFSYHTNWRWQEREICFGKDPGTGHPCQGHEKAYRGISTALREGHAQGSLTTQTSQFAPNTPRSLQTPRQTWTQLWVCFCFSATLEVGGLGSVWPSLSAKSHFNELLGIFLQKQNHVLPCLKVE